MFLSSNHALSRGLSAMITSGIMVVIVVIVVMLSIVFFIFCLHAKCHRPGASPNTPRSRLIFVPEQGTLQRQGLDRAVVQALPITVFRSEDFKEGLECAVCLSQLSEGDEARLLPKCNHGFHLDCIDMWFHSNSTCPLCRSPLCSDLLQGAGVVGRLFPEIPPTEEASRDGNPAEPPNFPANVLFWGFRDQVSTGVVGAAASPYQGSSSSEGSSSGKTEGMLVIDIPPRRVEDGFPPQNSPRPSIRLPEEETKSPTLVLRPLRRLWSSRGRSSGSDNITNS